MMKERIHNNDEGRWQHPELTGIALLDKVSQQLKHSPTSTPENPSSWISGGCQSPLLEKYWRGWDLNPDPGHHSGVFRVDVHGSGQSSSLGDDYPGSESRSSFSSLVFGLFSVQGSPRSLSPTT